jgi:hypothetical protein
METMRTITLAVTMAAGLAAAPVSQAQEGGRAEPLAVNLQALAPAPVVESARFLLDATPPEAAVRTDWQAWAAARHAEITERVLRETANRILAEQAQGPARIALHGGR